MRVAIRFLVGAAFCFAALAKLLWPCQAVAVLAGFLQSEAGARLGLVVVVGVEFAAGTWLIGEWRSGRPARLAAMLLAIFSLVLVAGLIRDGLSFRCGCFGELLADHPVAGLLRNLGLIAACLWLAKSRTRETATER